MAQERKQRAFRQISIFDRPEPTEPKANRPEPTEPKADRPEPTEPKADQLKSAEKGEIFKFPPRTPISLGINNQVHAENAFKVEKLPGQRWARLSAFKILENTLVYYHKDYEGKKYFHLTPGKVVGLYTTKTAYKPKPIK
ncbi:MAG: hypothetical protein GX559_03795 [Candidatus Pacebacteria bacterium]|nr:hypothetical protein [Candidatus Paceibacterota bacterium]